MPVVIYLQLNCSFENGDKLMKFVKLVFVVFTFAFLWGCASGARIENMTYEGIQKGYTSKLENNTDIGEVSGGYNTNPFGSSNIDNESFYYAVRESLKKQGLYSYKGTYQLIIQLIDLDKPLIGIDMTVTTSVNYTLIDTSNGRTIFTETIVTQHTATMSDAFTASKRIRLANEGAAKKNIELLLDKLARLRPQMGRDSLTL